MTTQVKDPQGIISVGQKGPEIDGSPVEFRYTHNEDSGALESCHVFAIVRFGGQDCLAEARQ